jgi:site-specific DNA-methyltransferase (adenine-specific)
VTPYFTDEHVTLYHGDCREIVPALGVAIDLIVADPPYGVTSLAWDDWCEGWLETVGAVSNSMWCFGSLAMFMARSAEYRGEGWALSSRCGRRTSTRCAVPIRAPRRPAACGANRR